MSLCIYSGGDTGYEERDALLAYLKGLDARKWLVIVHSYYNRKNDPPLPVLWSGSRRLFDNKEIRFMHETEHINEKVILVGLDTGNQEMAERSLDELAELAKTAGANVSGRLIQARESAHPATYIGKAN